MKARPDNFVLLLTVSLAAFGCSSSVPTPEELRPALQAELTTIERLMREYDAEEDVEDPLELGRELKRRLSSFAFRVRAADRPALRSFARSPQARQRELPLPQLLLSASEYEAALDVLMPVLKDAENPSYMLWKMCEEFFGQEPSFEVRSKLIGQALLNHHEQHPGDRQFVLTLLGTTLTKAREQLAGFTMTPAEFVRASRSRWSEGRLIVALDEGSLPTPHRLVRFQDLVAAAASRADEEDAEGGSPATKALVGTRVTMYAFSPIAGEEARAFVLQRAPFYSGHVGAGDHDLIQVATTQPATLRPGLLLRVDGIFALVEKQDSGYMSPRYAIQDATVTPVTEKTR